MSNRLGRKVVSQLVSGGLFRALLVFASAGSLAWWQGWAFVLSLSALATLSAVMIVQDSPELLEERRTASKKAKSWDKPLVALAVGVLPIAQMVVAGLDHRWGWTQPMPIAAAVGGLLVLIAGGLVGFTAVRANAFFSSFARIQSDRGHRVAEGGPYRFVRHPAYAAWSLSNLGAGVLFGSLPALAVGVAIALLLVVRTALEDRMLLAELDGYGDYAARVRFRLVPFVW